MNQNSKKHFWSWFEQNQEELRDLDDKPEAEYNHWRKELTDHFKALHEYCNGAVVSENEDAVLIISVDGRRVFFQEVDDLVAEAPEIPGWKFHALLPPGSYDLLVEKLKTEVGIDPDEFRFSFLMPTANNRAPIVVFHPLLTPENDFKVFKLAAEAVFNLLGERSFGNNIECIDVRNLSEAEPDKLYKLNILQAVFDSGFVINKDGGLVELPRKKK